MNRSLQIASWITAVIMIAVVFFAAWRAFDVQAMNPIAIWVLSLCLIPLALGVYQYVRAGKLDQQTRKDREERHRGELKSLMADVENPEARDILQVASEIEAEP